LYLSFEITLIYDGKTISNYSKKQSILSLLPYIMVPIRNIMLGYRSYSVTSTYLMYRFNIHLYIYAKAPIIDYVIMFYFNYLLLALYVFKFLPTFLHFFANFKINKNNSKFVKIEK